MTFLEERVNIIFNCIKCNGEKILHDNVMQKTINDDILTVLSMNLFKATV